MARIAALFVRVLSEEDNFVFSTPYDCTVACLDTFTAQVADTLEAVAVVERNQETSGSA